MRARAPAAGPWPAASAARGLVMAARSPSADSPARPVAPHGAWPSPLTAARVTAGALRFDQIHLDGHDVYWVEGRPSEGGRHVIVRRRPDGTTEDVTPPPFNVRSRVHEYGGAAYTVHEGIVFFANFADQRLYRQAPGGQPEPLTPEGGFFADFRVDPHRGRLVGVREDHTTPGEPIAAIVAVAAAGPGVDPGQVLVSGADFYSDPVISPDGTRMAWLEWDHPNMPWDGTQLWMAPVLGDGSLGARIRIAGGRDESIFQPEWSPDLRLHFVSDRTGWWNLYRVDDTGMPAAIHPMPAEFGKPQWSFSMTTYAFIGPGRIAATYAEQGRWKLAIVEGDPSRFEPVDLPLQPLESIRASAEALYFVGGSSTVPSTVFRVSLPALEIEALRASASETIAAEWLSIAEPVTFTVTPAPATADARGGPPPSPRDVHGFYYTPRNPDVSAPQGQAPPLVVVTHGGPTGATTDVLDLEVQFWTSRGFAVLDVDYSGSTGYGRAYRERLRGQWGIADVEDVVGGARAMVARGQADPERLIIRGGSAGGYTTLAALTFHRTFKAGASYYGISDVEVLARDTHKFESRYLDSLIGPYPEARDRYVARSPIHFVDRLSCPLILFQGLDDKMVPPDQSERMADAVRRKGLPVAYLAFEGEQHGFRKAETIVRALEAELAFYGEVFGFTPAGAVAPVHP